MNGYEIRQPTGLICDMHPAFKLQGTGEINTSAAPSYRYVGCIRNSESAFSSRSVYPAMFETSLPYLGFSFLSSLVGQWSIW